MPSNRARPTSEIFFSNPLAGNPSFASSSTVTPADAESVRVAEQWLADLEMYKTTLEDMASASVDKEFKDELAAVQQWFDVLSVGERTATLYSLLQQTSSIQVRFFLTVLQKMAKNDALAGILSPTVDHDMESMIPNPPSFQYPHQTSLTTAGYSDLRTGTPTSSRFNMDQLLPYPNQQVNNNNNNNHNHSQSQSAYDMNAAVAAAAAAAAVGLQVPPQSITGMSSISPLASKPVTRKDFTPWTHSEEINRPKSADVALSSSSSATNLHSQFKLNPPQSQSNVPNRFNTSSPSQNHTIHNNTNNATNVGNVSMGPFSNVHTDEQQQQPQQQIPVFPTFLPPMDFSGSWASAVNTPVSATFPGAQQQSSATNEIVNNTAMKLAALSTVNSRVVLDSDVKKFRRNNKNGSSNTNSSVVTSSNNSNPRSGSSNDNEANFVRPVPMHANNNHQQQHHNTNNINANNNNNNNAYSKNNNHNLKPTPRSHSRSRSRENNSSTSDKFKFPTASSSNPNVASANISHQANNAHGSASSAKEPFMDLALLEDISAWLKVLRLHKYTPVLGDLYWKDLVMLNDAQLEARGVSALGARRKMLKVFDQVKQAMENGELE